MPETCPVTLNGLKLTSIVGGLIGRLQICGTPAGFLRSSHVECEEQQRQRERLTEAGRRQIASQVTLSIRTSESFDGLEVRLSRAPFPDQHFDAQELFEEGDAVVVTWLWTATHKGDLPGFPASGKHIRMSGATVYYFEGSRITGHWQITDRLGVFQQLRQPMA